MFKHKGKSYFCSGALFELSVVFYLNNSSVVSFKIAYNEKILDVHEEYGGVKSKQINRLFGYNKYVSSILQNQIKCIIKSIIIIKVT